MNRGAWSPERATGWLLQRGMFGMEPGLERIRALLAELGDPQDGIDTIHVVGTNGKSSTSRYAAHLLAERGIKAGAYLSPHLVGFEERVLLPANGGLAEADPERFAAAVGRVAGAVDAVERGLDPSDRVTQFEAVTAAAFMLIRESDATVAVIEAGMGGRFDATNVLPAGVVVLTPIGLDHTRWLGPDLDSIAGEKLAVVGAGDRLVIAGDHAPEVSDRIREAGLRSGHPVTVAPLDPGHGVRMEAVGRFQRANLALAESAVDLMLAGHDREATRRVAARVTIPGRMQQVASGPDTFVDSAHNPAGMTALAQEIVALAGGRQVIAVIGVLGDKDAAGMIDAILPLVDSTIATAPDTPRALDASVLADLARGRGASRVEVVEGVREAVVTSRSRAGRDGLVIVTGSVHTVGEAVSLPGERVVTSL